MLLSMVPPALKKIPPSFFFLSYSLAPSTQSISKLKQTSRAHPRIKVTMQKESPSRVEYGEKDQVKQGMLLLIPQK